MIWLGAAALAVVAVVLGAKKASTPDVSVNSSLKSRAQDAIQTRITDKLNLPDNATLALLAQSAVETANWTSYAFLHTNSLFNRHVGNGRVGVPNSDGFWTGQSFYLSQADPNLRVYSDIYQAADDMAQLLQEGLYRGALAALEEGNAKAYADALEAVGFAAERGYNAAIIGVYNGFSNVG